jgi:hypothetical protein
MASRTFAEASKQIQVGQVFVFKLEISVCFQANFIDLFKSTFKVFYAGIFHRKEFVSLFIRKVLFLSLKVVKHKWCCRYQNQFKFLKFTMPVFSSTSVL